MSEVYRVIDGTNILLGAQDVYFEEKGAFTSQISCDMLKDVGCTYVITGHSETRQYLEDMISSMSKEITMILISHEHIYDLQISDKICLS